MTPVAGAYRPDPLSPKGVNILLSKGRTVPMFTVTLFGLGYTFLVFRDVQTHLDTSGHMTSEDCIPQSGALQNTGGALSYAAR